MCHNYNLAEYQNKFQKLFPEFKMIPFKLEYYINSKAKGGDISLGKMDVFTFNPFTSRNYYSFASLRFSK